MVFVLGIQAARQLHGAQLLRLKGFAHALKRLLEKAIIKAHIVRHKHTVLQPCPHLVCHSGKLRRSGDHGIGNARDGFDKRGNVLLRIDQALVTGHALAFHPNNRNLGDAVVLGAAACGFQIDKCIRCGCAHVAS